MFVSQPRACPGLFTGGKAEGPKAVSGGGVLGERAATPPHQLGGLRSGVSSSPGFGEERPTAQRFSTIFSTRDVLSCHCDIVSCGLSCSRDPVAALEYAAAVR